MSLQVLRLDNVVNISREFHTAVIEQHRVTHRCFLRCQLQDELFTQFINGKYIVLFHDLPTNKIKIIYLYAPLCV